MKPVCHAWLGLHKSVWACFFKWLQTAMDFKFQRPPCHHEDREMQLTLSLTLFLQPCWTQWKHVCPTVSYSQQKLESFTNPCARPTHRPCSFISDSNKCCSKNPLISKYNFFLLFPFKYLIIASQTELFIILKTTQCVGVCVVIKAAI